MSVDQPKDPIKLKLQKRLQLISEDAITIKNKEKLEMEEEVYQEVVGRLVSAAREGETGTSFGIKVVTYEANPALMCRLRADGLRVNCHYDPYESEFKSQYGVSWVKDSYYWNYPKLVPLAGFIVSCISLAYWLVQYVG